MTSTSPDSVTHRVMRMNVSCRLVHSLAPTGLSDQCPCVSSPRMRANSEAESNRGMHNQSIDPVRPTSAADRQSPMRA